MGFATDAVHAGQAPDEETGAVVVPIYQTSTYAQLGPGEHKGYEYGRTGNPTREALEKNVAVLEGANYGFAFSSGMAAISAVTGLLKEGDHVVVTANVYGGTYRYFEQIMTQYGLRFSWVDTSDLGAVEAALRPETKMLFVETPTNPMLKLSDLTALSGLTKSRGLLHAVDNTFLSPYFQRPLQLGADIVIHSSTKYLNGHSDLIGGLVLVNEERLAERLGFWQNAVGAVPSPFDCWLLLRATKTLHLRMKQHNASAMAIANYLTRRTDVEQVYYPGLPSHPQYDLACRQQVDPYGEPGFGGMISIDVGSYERAVRLLKAVRLFVLAESLGGVESLISHPASMTHASIPKAERESYGLTDGLVRLSVGVEDVDDLISDLGQALDAV